MTLSMRCKLLGFYIQGGSDTEHGMMTMATIADTCLQCQVMPDQIIVRSPLRLCVCSDMWRCVCSAVMFSLPRVATLACVSMFVRVIVYPSLALATSREKYIVAYTILIIKIQHSHDHTLHYLVCSSLWLAWRSMRRFWMMTSSCSATSARKSHDQTADSSNCTSDGLINALCLTAPLCNTSSESGEILTCWHVDAHDNAMLFIMHSYRYSYTGML